MKEVMKWHWQRNLSLFLKKEHLGSELFMKWILSHANDSVVLNQVYLSEENTNRI